MTYHEVNLSIFRMVRDMLLHDDGSLKPCIGTELNPQWVYARAANIATALIGNYDVRPNAVSGEIDPAKVHQAMQDAPHDGQLYRQARAAVEAVSRYHFEHIEDEPPPVRPEPFTCCAECRTETACIYTRECEEMVRHARRVIR